MFHSINTLHTCILRASLNDSVRSEFKFVQNHCSQVTEKKMLVLQQFDFKVITTLHSTNNNYQYYLLRVSSNTFTITHGRPMCLQTLIIPLQREYNCVFIVWYYYFCSRNEWILQLQKVIGYVYRYLCFTWMCQFSAVFTLLTPLYLFDKLGHLLLDRFWFAIQNIINKYIRMYHYDNYMYKRGTM